MVECPVYEPYISTYIHTHTPIAGLVETLICVVVVVAHLGVLVKGGTQDFTAGSVLLKRIGTWMSAQLSSLPFPLLSLRKRVGAGVTSTAVITTFTHASHDDSKAHGSFSRSLCLARKVSLFTGWDGPLRV